MLVYPLCRKAFAYNQAELHSHPAAEASGVHRCRLTQGTARWRERTIKVCVRAWRRGSAEEAGCMVGTVELCATVFCCADTLRGGYEDK